MENGAGIESKIVKLRGNGLKNGLSKQTPLRYQHQFFLLKYFEILGHFYGGKNENLFGVG